MSRPFDSETPPPNHDDVDLLDHIEVLVRRRWQVILGTLLCMLSAAAFVSQEIEVFRAKAIILPADTFDYLDLVRVPTPILPKQSFYLDILESTPISRKVLDKTYTYEGQNGETRSTLFAYFNTKSPDIGLRRLRRIVDFEAKRTGVITITTETRSPRLSAAVANEYVAQLKGYQQRTRRVRVDNQTTFMDQRLKTIESELDSLQQALVYFHRRNRDIADQQTSHIVTDSYREYQRLQSEITIHNSLFSTMLNQREIAQVEAQKVVQDFEVLAYAEPPEFGTKIDLKYALIVSATAGLVVMITLAFMLEYLARNRRAGRLDGIYAEFRKDAHRLRHPFERGDYAGDNGS